MAKYNMTFEEAQEYISKRGFDIPWNDCDVFIDERYITQTVGNVLKWADNNPKWKPSDEQMKAVKEAACYSSVFSEKTIDNLISLSEQLKKLKAL